MLKVGDRELELLARAGDALDGVQGINLSFLICPDETSEYYRGMVAGLALAHVLLRASKSPGVNTEALISLAACQASDVCRKVKDVEDAQYAEVNGIM